MLSKFQTLFSGLLFCSIINYVCAANPIATVEIPVSNQEEQLQVIPLLSQGLATVLTRLTGNPTITEQKSIANIINKPDDYLENYTQQSQPDRLVISFDQQAIEQFLAKENIDYWDKRRPVIMTWWLNETTNTLVDDTQPFSKMITTAANTQGFPLRFPIGDLNDQALANKENFNAAMPKEILQNTKQYMANATLIVYVLQKGNAYQANWQLWLTNDDTKPLTQGNIDGKSEQQIAEQLFTTLNPLLAKVFVIKTNTTETIDLVIKDLDYSRYVEVNNLLNSFGGKAIETTGSTVRYEVKANPEQIKAQLNLLHFMEETNSETKTTTNVLTLTFRPDNK